MDTLEIADDSISLQTFLAMVDIRFRDDSFVMNRRLSEMMSTTEDPVSDLEALLYYIAGFDELELNQFVILLCLCM